MNHLPARDIDLADADACGRYALRFKLLIFHRNPNLVRQKKRRVPDMNAFMFR